MSFLYLLNSSTRYSLVIRKMSNQNIDLTVHSAHIEDVYEMPMDQIIRPLPSMLDSCKVDSLMDTLKAI